MADTGGTAALINALNQRPALGAGLGGSGVTRPSSATRTSAAGASSLVDASNAIFSTSPAQTGSAALRSARSSLASASPAAPQKLPKIAAPEGKGYDPKAPKGTYVNVVI